MASIDLRSAAQQALEALERYQRMMMAEAGCQSEEGEAAIDNLRAALAEPNRAQKMTEAGYTRRPSIREMAEPCPCGDRPKDQCHGEWEPGCDLGNNPKYARRRVNLAEPEPPLGKASTDVGVPVYVVKKAEPVQEPVAQISANRVIAAIEEWKSLWWKVPPFASKVNRATREAITVSHNPLFALLLDAQAAKQMPKGCTTPSGCQQHGCHGDCLPTEPQRPAEPVGVVTSMVKGGVTWRRWPADMPDGTRLFSEVQP